MTMNRREFLAASVTGAAILGQGLTAFGEEPAGSVQVEVDATKQGEPVTPLIFGGYMEPATTRVWAEMLSDRKFAQPITNTPPNPSNSFFRRFERLWMPVGTEGTVKMDAVRPFVGEHSPRVRMDGAEARGIQQSGLHLGRGRRYVGRIYLAGDASAQVKVRLVWGHSDGESQTVTIPPLSPEYRIFPLQFTPTAAAEDARLEILGVGSGSFHIGAASLMPADNTRGFHAGMIRLYRDARIKMTKWPGGNFVSAYDWYDGIGDRDRRPPRPEPMWGNAIESNDVGIHEFVDFCRLLDAEPYVAINSGFGGARVAAEEVEYCNGSTETRLGKMRADNGHPEPFNIRLWCAGNEMYGWWQFGHMSLNQYWVKHNSIVEAMKKVDPTIKITSAAASICERSWCDAEQHDFGGTDIWRPPVLEKLPYKFGGTYDWDGWMLEKCADNIDHLSEHTYAYPDLYFDDAKQHFERADDPLQMRARRMSNRIGEAFDAWQNYVEKMPSLKSKNIKFIFDEWGTRFRSANGGFHRPSGMVSPLSYALFLHELFRHSDMVAASCPTAGLNTVLVDNTGEATGFSAEGLVMKLMATHFAGALPVDVKGNSPQQPVRGTPFLDIPTSPIGSPTYPLDVVAAISGDRKTFLVSVVNPTEAAQDFAPQLAGVKLQASGKLWQIAPPNVNAANEPGKEPVIQILEHQQITLSERVNVPPFSINVYEFRIA
ncbi:MAG: alpha-N-arabinofuranosidase [Candidatus Acidiferrales bacterium]